MKGLIIKDLFLMKRQLKLLAIFLLLGLVLSLSDKIEFGFVYVMVIVSSIAQATINYDEFDNGFPFLISLPISRKKYVQSKYILGLFLGVVTIGIMAGLYILVSFFMGHEILLRDLGLAIGLQIFVLSILNSIFIPVVLKYGVEKSKMAIFLVFALFAVIGFIIGFLWGSYAPLQWKEIFERLFFQSFVFIFTSLMISFIALAISYFLSIKIFKSKEF